MKFIVYLMTMLFVGSAIAQNPTILQGSYISNVFGNSNFVLNPNAQTNIANVTNATRSTTTPLVATSEFTLALASGANATWTLRAFDAGMKGQNCEARFSYRGFATATTKAEIVQNSLVVATLTLTPSTDPRIASINFPCGDLAHLTTFRIAQTTAAMTATNEIGGIYVGLATNMANVAQAEFVGDIKFTSCPTAWQLASPTVFTSFSNLGSACTVTTSGTITNSSSGLRPEFGITGAKAGRYMITVNSGAIGSYKSGTATAMNIRLFDGTSGISEEPYSSIEGASAVIAQFMSWRTFNVEFTGAVTNKTINFQVKSTDNVIVNAPLTISVYRFPSSSELVVTPERQNTWASAEWNNADLFQYFGVAEPTGFLSYTRSGSFTAVYNGSAQAPLSATQVGFSVPNLPVGKYELRINQGLRAAPGITSGNSVVCDFRLRETTTNIPVGLAEQLIDRDVNLNVIMYGDKHVVGIFNNTSTGTRNFIYEANKIFDNNATNNGQCGLQTTVYQARPVVFTLIPLDQPSNSALYVQGPVLGANTGAAIPAGYAGETIASAATNTVAAPSGSWVFASSGVTLQPGVYLISHWCSWNYPAANQAFSCMVSTNNTTGGSIWPDQTWNQVTWVNGTFPHAITIAPKVIRITTPTLLYFGAVQLGVASNTASHRMEALRIN